MDILIHTSMQHYMLYKRKTWTYGTKREILVYVILYKSHNDVDDVSANPRE